MDVHSPESEHTQDSPLWRRIVVLCFGGIVLVAGIIMLILPGPAFIFIPLGLAILATEFRWARNWLSRIRQLIRRSFKRSG